MHRVYLDNNIFVDIESGTYSVDLFLNKTDCSYYYSQAHISELMEAMDNPKVSQKGRLALIAKSCRKNHILTGVMGKPEFFEKELEEMYRLALNTIELQKHINRVVCYDNGAASKLRQELDFDTIQFNNEPPETILTVIDKRMKEKIGFGIINYLVSTEAYGGKQMYHTLLNLIDMANYWGDKKTNHSDVARLNDASHAYFAQLCDILVTNDKRMQMKVNAIYSFLGVKTIVMSAIEFFEKH